jgi:5,10-methylenetetrahydromethanopterin reductase
MQDPFPIKLGGMRGPRSFELAGEIADGLHTACAYSREALEFTASAFRRGAEKSGRDWRDLDLADNPLGAIAPESGPAREAARIMAAFHIGSMPPELLARHGIESEDVKPIVEAFTAGDVQHALELTPPEPRRAATALPRRGHGRVRRLTRVACKPSLLEGERTGSRGILDSTSRAVARRWSRREVTRLISSRARRGTARR